ncbi:MAG: hypothetical protein PHI18_02225 [bacterium]|nr:hypothetical protein [bacterium]
MTALAWRIAARSVAAGLLVLIPLCLTAETAFAPPADARIQTVSGARCYSGEVFLASPADTLALAALGFSQFEFRGRSVRTVKYGAVWRTDADLSKLPASVSGVTYDEVVVALPRDVAAASEISSVEDLDAALQQAREPRAETGPTVMRKYYVTPDGRFIPIERVRSTFVNAPVEPTRRSSEDFEREDLMNKGAFITSPSDHHPFRRKENVGWSDPDITGTYRVTPVEKGNFHKKENVGKRDPATCGDFQITPYSTLKDCGIGSTNWYKKPSGTGSFGFGPSSYRSPGVGYRSFPVSYPEQYRPTIRVQGSRR